MPDVLVYVEKRFDKKPMVNFKNYHVTDWTTNNYNTRMNIKTCKILLNGSWQINGTLQNKKRKYREKSCQNKI